MPALRDVCFDGRKTGRLPAQRLGDQEGSLWGARFAVHMCHLQADARADGRAGDAVGATVTSAAMCIVRPSLENSCQAWRIHSVTEAASSTAGRAAPWRILS